MRIGVPREIKTLEGRVALVPAAAATWSSGGHEVWVEQGAGVKSGFKDESNAGRRQDRADAAALYEKGELIVKVKEPIEGDLKRLRKDHLLFCYLHLAALPELTRRLLDIGLTGVAFETVEQPNGDCRCWRRWRHRREHRGAGRHHLLHQPQGGKGKLLGGLPSTERGKVVVFGGGEAGGNSALVAAAGGVEVVVFDKDRMDELVRRAPGQQRHRAVSVCRRRGREVRAADLVVGAVLVTGARAPHVLTREMSQACRTAASSSTSRSTRAAASKPRVRPPGRSRPTWRRRDPFLRDQHAGRRAADLLAGRCAAILPSRSRLAAGDWRDEPAWSRGINVEAGKVVHPALHEMKL